MHWPWTKENDLDREVRYHLETLADAFERQGMSREDAMRQARIEFGGVDRVKDECRDEHAWNWISNIAQDVRFGWRMMRKTPAISIAAVLSLALGIGATTAILTLADGLLWRTVGVPAPEQLVELMWQSKTQPENLVHGSMGGGYRDGGTQVADFFSRPAYEAMRTHLAGKAQVAGHIGAQVVSTSFHGQILITRARGVSGNFFSSLQLQPFDGRLLTDADDDRAAPPVVVVTHRFWTRHLGADRAVLGTAMRINNIPYTIAGVLPPQFTGIVAAEETDLYCAIAQSPAILAPKGLPRDWISKPTTWWLQLTARRMPGVSTEELRSQLDAAFASSWVARPKSPESTPHLIILDASHGLGGMRRQFGNPVTMLLGLVALVLLVACANIANLLLARAAEREKEVALRVSLGCGAARLVRQFFTESLMLAAMGGALSIGVAAFLGALMVKLIPQGFEGMALSFEPDSHSLAAAAAVTLLTALLFGLYPAWRASRIDSSPALKEGSGSGGTVSRARWMPARLLVLFQVALGVLLVTAAIVFTTHLNEMVNRDAGFDRGHSILFDVRPGEMGYSGDRLRQFYIDLEERLAHLPGVEAAALSRTRPMRGGGYFDGVTQVGQSKEISAAVHLATPRFFDALGVPVVAGRGWTTQEVQSAAKVLVISEEVAKELNAPSPLGVEVKFGDGQYTVIGVARRAQYAGLHEASAIVYGPFDYTQQSATVIARTSIPPLVALGAIRDEIKQMDRDLPLVDVYTMEQQISRTLQRERLFAWLCGSFGVLALILCVVGLYGLMSHMTARRTPEMGIRMALGASRTDVLGQVLREGMKLAAVGLILGIPLAAYATRLAETQRLLPEGPVPYAKLAAALGILTIFAILAVLGPAIRASTVDPMRALRQG